MVPPMVPSLGQLEDIHGPAHGALPRSLEDIHGPAHGALPRSHGRYPWSRPWCPPSVTWKISMVPPMVPSRSHEDIHGPAHGALPRPHEGMKEPVEGSSSVMVFCTKASSQCTSNVISINTCPQRIDKTIMCLCLQHPGSCKPISAHTLKLTNYGPVHYHMIIFTHFFSTS